MSKKGNIGVSVVKHWTLHPEIPLPFSCKLAEFLFAPELSIYLATAYERPLFGKCLPPNYKRAEHNANKNVKPSISR